MSTYNRHHGGRKAGRTRRRNDFIDTFGADALPECDDRHEEEQPATFVNGEAQYFPQPISWKEKAEQEKS